MVYVILNFVLASLLLWLSFYADEKLGNKGVGPIIVMNSLLAVGCVMMGLAVIFSVPEKPEHLSTFLGRCMFAFMGMYAIKVSSFFILFPQHNQNTAYKVINFIGYAFCFWVMFTKVDVINITAKMGFVIEDSPVFSGELGRVFPYRWCKFYQIIMVYVLPFLSAIIMLLRSECRSSKLDHQKTIINALGIVLAWGVFQLVLYASNKVPLFSSLCLIGFFVVQILVVLSASLNFVFDWFSIITLFVKLIVCYVVPSLFVGLTFPLIWKIYPISKPIFFIVFAIVIGVSVIISYELRKYLKNKSIFYSNHYGASFEQDLASMDYGDEPSEIVNKMGDIFSNNIGITSFKVFVDSGNGEITLIGNQDDHKKIIFNEKDELFDILLNMNTQVVLKSFVEEGHKFNAVKKELLSVFRKTKSEAMIILNEGRHILGFIFLGAKLGGNIYSDYDYDIFRKFYSYFFVFGYYMKNIGNQEIIGTVNREIHMSEQIIESIQRNMDPIKNKKYDVGNLMVHAHNIGGEFIDLIKLSEDKHVFVMGDLSGKGISASMSMVIVKSIIRTYLADASDFKLLVEKINKFIRFNLPKGTFFEGVFGLIDFKDNTVYYINCGVPAMFLYTRTYNNIVEIQGEGHVLGFVKDISSYIKVKKMVLNPGDILVTCTDGLIDSHSLRGEQFGKDRVQKLIAENTSLPAQKIAESTYSSLVEFVTTELEDDVSILVMKIGR